jgi:hypothetical protein
MEELLTTIEASKVIKRSPGALRNLVARRKIPFRKAGGRLYFLKEELLWWINSSPGITKMDIIERRKNE